MDFIIAIGGLVTGIGLIINVFNTRIKYGWCTHYQSKSRPLNYVSLLLIIIGLIIIIGKAYLNGQLN
ncbi:hypothetical protein [Lactiplantibacillus plantarum]|uniref:hypothetical protein n=1 Tax=Lactiplantibacillus plantarum TaxID=1590 RepID=UPI001756E4BA|nr:hypothetical protein [Lactiplantibacillus plantarum]GFE99975.1 membrane protein [Lactiplantibacillus plantarum]